MSRSPVNVLTTSDLHELSEVHDSDPVSQIVDDREVVRDHDVGQPVRLTWSRFIKLSTCERIETSSALTGSSATIS